MKTGDIFIAVIGGSDISAPTEAVAEETGRQIARQGAVLVCGGLGGVMEAACRGAASEGGLTVGILPGDNRRSANPYVRVPVATGIGYARNAAVVRSAQAAIAIDGSYGTLTEIGYALQGGIPVIGLDTWSVAINGREDKNIIRATSPEDAVKTAISLIKDGYV
jgi:uncharacterized protein (TIGR00725 family)